MADQKISQLPAATDLAGLVLAGAQGGANKTASPELLRAGLAAAGDLAALDTRVDALEARATPIVFRAAEYIAPWAIPADLTEFNAGAAMRAIGLLAGATQCRFVVTHGGSDAGSGQLRVQGAASLAPTSGDWAYLDGATGPTVAPAAGQYRAWDSGWVSIAPALRQELVLLRVVGVGGDGSAGYWGGLTLFVR